MLEQLTQYFNIISKIYFENPIGQFFGLIAFLITIYNFLFCKDKKFILINMIASAFWGIHFFAIGLFPASFINFIDVGKNALALKFEKNKIIAFSLIIIYIVISYFTYNGLISLIPLSTAILSTFLVFYVRGIFLNVGFLFVLLLWAVYNYIGHSIGGLITDVTLIISSIIGILRTLYKNNKLKKLF